jgi:hypothetical protein
LSQIAGRCCTEFHFAGSNISPEFSINYSAMKYFSIQDFSGIDAKGDSIVESPAEMFSEFCDNSGYFRLQANKKKHVVVLI